MLLVVIFVCSYFVCLFCRLVWFVMFMVFCCFVVLVWVRFVGVWIRFVLFLFACVLVFVFIACCFGVLYLLGFVCCFNSVVLRVFHYLGLDFVFDLLVFDYCFMFSLCLRLVVMVWLFCVS